MDFKEMQQTLPNLMNSLRNIWMLSKHYNTDEQICGQLNMNMLHFYSISKSRIQIKDTNENKNKKFWIKKWLIFSGLLDKVTNILLGRVKRFVDFNLLHTPGNHFNIRVTYTLTNFLFTQQSSLIFY